MSNANLKVTEGMVLTSSTLQAVHNEILQGRTLDTLPEISETALKTEMEPKVQNLLISSKNSIAELKKEVERMKININLFSKNLDLEKRFRKLETINPTERDHVLNAVQTFNEQNNAHILNFHAELSKLEQQYLQQDQKFTQIFNAYCLYVLQQQQAHKKEIKSIETRLKTIESVTQHFSRNIDFDKKEEYNNSAAIKIGGTMLENGVSPWSEDLTTYTCPVTGIYEFHVSFWANAGGKAEAQAGTEEIAYTHFRVNGGSDGIYFVHGFKEKELFRLHYSQSLKLKKNDKITMTSKQLLKIYYSHKNLENYSTVNTTVTYWPT